MSVSSSSLHRTQRQLFQIKNVNPVRKTEAEFDKVVDRAFKNLENVDKTLSKYKQLRAAYMVPTSDLEKNYILWRSKIYPLKAELAGLKQVLQELYEQVPFLIPAKASVIALLKVQELDLLLHRQLDKFDAIWVLLDTPLFKDLLAQCYQFSLEAENIVLSQDAHKETKLREIFNSLKKVVDQEKIDLKHVTNQRLVQRIQDLFMETMHVLHLLVSKSENTKSLSFEIEGYIGAHKSKPIRFEPYVRKKVLKMQQQLDEDLNFEHFLKWYQITPDQFKSTDTSINDLELIILEARNLESSLLSRTLRLISGDIKSGKGYPTLKAEMEEFQKEIAALLKRLKEGHQKLCQSEGKILIPIYFSARMAAEIKSIELGVNTLIELATYEQKHHLLEAEFKVLEILQRNEKIHSLTAHFSQLFAVLRQFASVACEEKDDVFAVQFNQRVYQACEQIVAANLIKWLEYEWMDMMPIIATVLKQNDLENQFHASLKDYLEQQMLKWLFYAKTIPVLDPLLFLLKSRPKYQGLVQQLNPEIYSLYNRMSLPVQLPSHLSESLAQILCKLSENQTAGDYRSLKLFTENALAFQRLNRLQVDIGQETFRFWCEKIEEALNVCQKIYCVPSLCLLDEVDLIADNRVIQVLYTALVNVLTGADAAEGAISSVRNMLRIYPQIPALLDAWDGVQLLLDHFLLKFIPQDTALHEIEKKYLEHLIIQYLNGINLANRTFEVMDLETWIFYATEYWEVSSENVKKMVEQRSQYPQWKSIMQAYFDFLELYKKKGVIDFKFLLKIDEALVLSLQPFCRPIAMNALSKIASHLPKETLKQLLKQLQSSVGKQILIEKLNSS